MKRGQTEMIGLVVFVLLVVFGFVFVYWISSLQPDKSVLRTYEEQQFSEAFISSIVRADVVVCGDAVRVGELLRTLAENGTGPCVSTLELTTVLTTVFSDAVNGTLDVWGRSYKLSVEHTEELLFVESTPPCDPDADRLPAGSQLIPSSAGPVELLLEICV